jgi:hypothetical protein
MAGVPQGAAPWGAILAALAVAAVVIVVYRGALGYFFAQDDFAGLARARGVLPALSGPWRYISGQFYFDLMRGLADLDPLPYRVVSLGTHTACALLLFWLLRRGAGAPGALVGATFFAAHPAIFTAVYSISGIGELLAGMFAALTLLAVGGYGAARLLALPAFALSLLCKESTVFLPLAVATLHAWQLRAAPGKPPRRWYADRVLWGLSALSLAFLATYIAGDAFGVRRSLPESAPYALRLDASLWQNSLTYLGWTLNFAIPTVRRFADAIDATVFAWGATALAIGILGAQWRPLRERGWLVGVAIFVTTLAPVLPLANHTYHYYLYSPLLGASWCVAATMAALGSLARRRRAVFEWALAIPCVAALALNGALLVRKIEHAPFSHPELRSDATVDRALIARRVYEDLSAAALPPGVELRFWSPASRALERERRPAGIPESEETYWERNVRTALLDGIALRVLFPQVGAVRFVREFEPAGDSTRYAVYLPTGALRVGTSAELEHYLSQRGEPRQEKRARFRSGGRGRRRSRLGSALGNADRIE